jgi:hypothetical protein
LDVAAAACLAVVAPDAFRLEVNVCDSSHGYSPQIPQQSQTLPKTRPKHGHKYKSPRIMS